MQKLQHTLHYPYQNSLCSRGSFSSGSDTWFCKLNIPVAVNVPDKVVQLCNCNSKLKCFKVFVDLFRKSVELAHYPLVLNG